MDKTFKCSKFNEDFVDCAYKIVGPEEEIFDPIKDHLMTVHELDEEEITPEMEDHILISMNDVKDETYGENEEAQ